MLQERDLFKLLGSFISSEVQKQIATLHKQLDIEINANTQLRVKCDALALRVAALETEDKTEAIRANCAKQLSESMETCVQVAVAEFFDEHPVLHGKDGKDGENGKDGADGIDGSSVDLDDITALLQSMLAEAISKIEKPPHIKSTDIDQRGHLKIIMSDGALHDVGRVCGQAGPRGENGKDGIDGLGIDQIDYDGERTMRLINEKADRTFVLPIPIYRGLWIKERLYERGDTVTSDGSTYTAMENTDREPGTLDSGWRLSVKRGREGRNKS